MRCVFILFFIFWSCSVNAQKGKPRVLTQEETKMVKKDAATLFTTTDYRSALGAYLELYNADPQNVEYNYRLGYCYLVTTVNKKAALKHLEFAIQSKKDLKTEWHFYLGLAYMYNNRWDEAIQSFNTYKTESKSKPLKEFLTPDRLIEMCNNGKELVSKPVDCVFSNLGKTINSAYEEYNPVISSDGKLLFYTSRRKGNMGGFIEDLGIYTADIYFSLWKDTIWSKPKSIGANVNTGWDEVTVGINATGNQLLVYFDNEETFGDIGVSVLKGKMWMKSELLPPPINLKDEENSACFSADNSTVYFSSNRKEGIGGKDIWMSKKAEGIWQKPVNLGSTINTTYDEKNPFLSLDGKRLYFSSQGWNSMGDFDIFCSTWNESEGKWSHPVNIGYPLNDAEDNSFISFTGDNRFAYVSANRPEGLGDRDIYRIEFKDSLHHPFAHVVKGVISGASGRLEIRSITFENAASHTTKKIDTDKSTNQFVLTAEPGEYILTVKAKNHETYTDTLTIGNEFPPLPVTKSVKLQSSK